LRFDRAAAQTGGRTAFIPAAVVLGLYVLFVCYVAINPHDRLGPNGASLFYDFGAFYQAATFADSGKAGAAYDDSAMVAAEQAFFGGAAIRLPWNYPPTFQLLLMPLAVLPYLPALILWSGALYGLYALLARKLFDVGHRWIVLLAPGAAVNLLVGQNGLISTVLTGGGVLLIRRRPIVGGALLGLLAYKPHFAVLAPLVLICGREWRALGGAIASGVGLTLLSVAMLGLEPWFAFLHKAANPSAIFVSSSSVVRSIPSVMIMARGLGLDERLSSALHWSVAAMAALGAVWVWRRTNDGRLRAAALATAMLIVTPYLRVYDLALLILPVAVLVQGSDAEVGIGEMIAAFAAWLLPVVLLFTEPRIPVGPIVTVTVMGLIVRRAARADARPREGVGHLWFGRAGRRVVSTTGANQ
jgi:hypothetical protein